MIWEIIPVALVTSVVTTFATIYLGEKKLRRDYQLEFCAERIAQKLFLHKKWVLRSFDVIKHHLGGFGDDELRQILVRAGGIRFESESGTELWGLLTRNRHRLGVIGISGEPETSP